MTQPVLFEINPAGIGLIIFNRPGVRNALDWDAMHALGEAVEEAEKAASLRVLILTGSGGAFIAGGDLRALHDDHSESDGLRQHDLMTGILDRLATLPVPVIAAIEGAARGGGCEVALACDLRIAAGTATLGFAQVSMAVTPGWGGAERLFDLVGYSRAIDLLISGRVLAAEEALAMGLINRICPAGQALDEAQALAEQIAAGPPLAMGGIKDVLHGYVTMRREEARWRERAVFARLWTSADHAEAAAAFLEKRPPVFRGE